MALDTIFEYQGLGVYAYAGPNWETDKKVLIKNFPQNALFYESLSLS